MPPQCTQARRTILIVTVLAAAAVFAACGSEEPKGAPAGERSAEIESKLTGHPEIAFSRATGGSSAGIYVMNADGSSQTRLTDTRNVDLDPAFSPDGERIAFARIEGKASDVYVMNADGSGQTNLTDSPAPIDAAPAFSPDGQKIAFTTSRDSPRPRGGPSLILRDERRRDRPDPAHRRTRRHPAGLVARRPPDRLLPRAATGG